MYIQKLSTTSYLAGTSLMKHLINFSAKRTKQDTKKLHGFYSRNNSDCIQRELLPLEIYFLAAV